MDKTTAGKITPGGRPVSKLENPPSAEAGPVDSGGGQLLLVSDPFVRSSLLLRSPPTTAITDREPSTQGKQKSIEVKHRESQDLTSLQENQLDTDKERMLYKALLTEKAEKNDLIDRIRQLEERMREIEQKENDCSSCGIRKQKVQYETDEEELKRETEWILKRNTKKRKANQSPYVSPGKEIGSRQEGETSGIDNVQMQRVERLKLLNKVHAPPPINVSGVSEYHKLQEIIKNTVEQECKITALNNNAWKINTPDPNSYRALAAKLNEKNFQWHTYENKNERPIKVMARGLHSSCDRNDIIKDLKSKGFNVLDAINILKKEKRNQQNGEPEIIKRGLPIFMLTFDNKDNIEKIYAIKTILSMVVKIEPLRKNNRLIPQCKRCQEFNHTQRYCQKEPRCVRCAGKHLTTKCIVRKNTLPKCINCGGEHPASYRGCEVAKELQKRRDNIMKSKQQVQYGEKENSFVNTHLGYTQNLRLKSYAQAISNSEEKTTSIEKTLNLILSKLNEQQCTNKQLFDKINNLETELRKNARKKQT